MTKRQIKLALTKARTGKVRARYSDELKDALVEYGCDRRSDGATWREVGDELGLTERMVSVLCRPRRARGRLREVAIVSDVAPSDTALSIALPGGAVVMGLDAAALAVVLKALR